VRLTSKTLAIIIIRDHFGIFAFHIFFSTKNPRDVGIRNHILKVSIRRGESHCKLLIFLLRIPLHFQFLRLLHLLHLLLLLLNLLLLLLNLLPHLLLNLLLHLLLPLILLLILCLAAVGVVVCSLTPLVKAWRPPLAVEDTWPASRD